MKHPLDVLLTDPSTYGLDKHPVRPGLTILDCGCNVPGGWEAARLLTLALMEAGGFVSFHDYDTGSYRLPALNICYDRPVALINTLGQPLQANVGQILGPALAAATDRKWLFLCLSTLEVGRSPEALLASEPVRDLLTGPGLLKQDQVVLAVAPATSLVGTVLQVSRALPQTLKALLDGGLAPGQVYWGWSNCLLPPLVDDFREAAQRLATTLACSATISLWVRGIDEHLASLLASIPLKGQVRLHNLTSARTVTRGVIDHDRLKTFF